MNFDLGTIASDIGEFCRKWGRMPVTQTKEKYNSVRVYCGFGISGLHGLIYPGYCYSQFPKWLWKLDIYYITRMMAPLNVIIIPYQKFIYRWAYWRQIKKYPHLFSEITSSMDHPEVLGWYIPRLCYSCIDKYKKSCYIVKDEECEFCKENS